MIVKKLVACPIVMLAIAVACSRISPRPESVTATSTRAPLDVGTVVAVEEIGDATIVLDETRAFTLRGGTLAAVTEHPWVGGAVVPAPDGEGRWATGIDRDGRLWRITIAGELEDVTDRFGIGDARVVAVGSAGTTMAFGLGGVRVAADSVRSTTASTDVAAESAGSTSAANLRSADIREIAVSSDGVHVTRADLVPSRAGLVPAAEAVGTAIAIGRGRIAVASPRGVAVWDLATSSARDYAIPDARAIAMIDAPTGSRLAVATERVLWIESGDTLHRIVSPTKIRALAASGPRLWLLADRLYAVDNDTLRPVAFDGEAAHPPGNGGGPPPAIDAKAKHPLANTPPAASTAVFGSPSGDLWIASKGSLVRASIDGALLDPGWQSQIAPIFARVCAHCHRPGGEADIDLSTPAAWHAEHDEIRKRVIETRTMPPAGTDLSDADRAAIAAWLGH